MGFTHRDQHDGVTLVLGGGGGRGLAHIGAWRALQERGVRPERIVACSAGALIGACIAAGAGWHDLAARARRIATGIFSLNGRVLSQGMRAASLLREEPLRELIQTLAPAARRIDDLPLPLSVNAVDLATGEVVWFGEGGRSDVALADAVYASCALPLFFPPASLDGQHFIDGGILDPFPVAHARALGARRMVAVDLSTSPENPHRRPGMIDAYCRTLEILQERRGGPRKIAPSGDVVHIRPALAGRHTFDLARPESLIEAGYEATRWALAGAHPSGAAASAAPAEDLPSQASRPGIRATLRRLPGWLQAMPSALGRLAPIR